MFANIREQHPQLRSLNVREFRNAAPAALRFGPGMTVLLGCNGTGKTTLLELISMAVSGDFSPARRTSLDLTYELRDREFELRVALQNRPGRLRLGDIEKRSDPAAAPTELSWQCRIEISREQKRPLVLEMGPGRASAAGVAEILPGEALGNPFEGGIDYWSIVYFLQTHLLEEKPEFVPRFFGLGESVRMDEALGLYADIVGYTPGDAAAQARTLRPSVVVMRSDGRMHDFAHFVPSSFVETWKRFSRRKRRGDVPERTTKKRIEQEAFQDLRATSSSLPFLHMFVDLCGFRRAEMLFPHVGREVQTYTTTHDLEMSETVDRYGPAQFRFWTHGGDVLTHDGLSFGQKRLLAFLYYSASVRGPIIVDELVNGFHYRWIQACLRGIRGQAFMSSQNPLLLDHLEFDSAADAAERFVLCDQDNRGCWEWRNMSAQQSEAFFRAYGAGIQHVGEILRTLDLW